jgi:hypothetical protein
MFRVRTRSERSSSPTALRGTVGSARVWDAEARARAAEAPRAEPPPTPAPLTVAPAELVALVQGIVQVTLDTRLPDCPRDERRALALALQARLLELFGAPARSVEAPPHPRTPEAPPHAAPDVETHAPAVALEATASSTPRARALGLVLEGKLQELGGTLALRADLRARLVELVLAGLTDDSNPQTATPEELRSLDVLARRAAKLERSLHETRAALAYVSGLERVDEGLASIYRTVQGLAESDPRLEQKRGVLEQVFRANLALQNPSADG